MLSTVPGRSASFAQTWLRLLRIPNVRHLAEARFLTNMYFYSAVIVLFETSRGLTFTGIFLLESVLSLSAWLLDIPTGVWADRLGYRRLLIASRMLNAASVVVMLLAHGFLAFSFGAVLFGAGLPALQAVRMRCCCGAWRQRQTLRRRAGARSHCWAPVRAQAL